MRTLLRAAAFAFGLLLVTALLVPPGIAMLRRGGGVSGRGAGAGFLILNAGGFPILNDGGKIMLNAN